MAFNLCKSLGLFLLLNLLFFTGDCNTKPKLKPISKPDNDSGSNSGPGSCPIDTLKLGVCVNVLNGLVDIEIGTPPKEPCCPLIQGLLGIEVPVCLCTAIKANILGINLDIPVALSLLIGHCGGQLPHDFQCP